MGLYQVPLIGEDVEAWKYGPVVPSVYYDFRQYGREPIQSQRAAFIDGELRIPSVNDEETQQLLDSVWNAYHGLNGLQLSDITHRPQTPWDITWNQRGGCNMRGAVIPRDVIQSHYEQLANSRG